MTQHTLNGKIILAAKVPKDADSFFIGAECPACLSVKSWNCAHFDECGNNYPALKSLKGKTLLLSAILPGAHGSWELLGRLSEINGVQAANLVHTFSKIFGGVIEVCYYDYERPWKNETNPIINPIASFHSWCRSKGIGDNCVLLIKK